MRPTLGAMARFDLWPTPTVKGNYNRKGLSSKSGDGLATAVLQWPTQTARDYRGVHRSETSQRRRQESSRGIPLNEAAGGLLNPTWVEWLMGWPIGWTALQPLEMDRFLEWQQQHGGCYNDENNADRDTCNEVNDMGWCSATRIFDPIVGALLDEKPVDKRAVIKQLIEVLEDGDWDCQSDSDYWDHPLVRSIFKELHPDWFEDEESGDNG